MVFGSSRPSIPNPFRQDHRSQHRFLFVVTVCFELFICTITCYVALCGTPFADARHGTSGQSRRSSLVIFASGHFALCIGGAGVKLLRVCNYYGQQIQINLYLESVAYGLFYFNLSPGKFADSLEIYQEIGYDNGCRGSREHWVALVAKNIGLCFNGSQRRSETMQDSPMTPLASSPRNEATYTEFWCNLFLCLKKTKPQRPQPRRCGCCGIGSHLSGSHTAPGN